MNISKILGRLGTMIFVLAIGFAPVPSAHAGVPQLITYHGILKNSSGSFLTGTYSMTFKIYNVSTGGTALWTETQSSVSASTGKFSVQLGSVTALNLSFGSDYWLGIKVGTDAEMTPRVRLTSVGYAYIADTVVNGFTQIQHDALSHKNIEGVKDNTVTIAKTNFKLDAYSLAAANSMGDMVVDTFTDASGIHAASSSNYSHRGSPNYDVTVYTSPVDAETKLLLHMNGTNGSTTFTDSSASARTVTASGNAQLTTSQYKFASAGGVFDGTGDNLTMSTSTDFDYGSGDFTIDTWIRLNATGVQQSIWTQYNGASNNNLFFKISSSNKLDLYIEVSGAPWASITGTTSLTTGQWYHAALVRNGSTIKIYLNGTSEGSATVSGNGPTGSFSAISIGSDHGGGSYLNGWFDEFRISKGIARWTSNFTPPGSEYGSPAGSATVISNAYAEPVAPTEAMLIVDETLGTGSITYYVSRDNGTTWTTCAKETVTSISSQPSGTQLKWKAVIAGNAELNSIAVAV